MISPSLMRSSRLGGERFRNRPLLLWSATNAEDHIDNVAHVLLVGKAIGGFGGKIRFGAEMGSHILENFQARVRLQHVPAQKRLERKSRLTRRNALAQAGFQMRIWVKRVVFSTQKLFEVRLCESGVANHHRVRRKVAEALGAAADHAGDAADEITQRERVNKTEQVPNDNLAEVQAQPLGIDDSAPQHSFADGLTAPGPFQRDPIAERE